MPWSIIETAPPLPGPLPNPPRLIIPTAQDASRYKFVITDMIGRIIGEVLECSNKEFIQNLDNAQTAKFTTKITSPMADYIINNDCLCKCYRQPLDRSRPYRLLLVGDVLTEEEDTNSETGTITFTVADPLNRLLFRYLGKAIDGQNHGLGWSDGTAVAQKDVMRIIGDMLLQVNADPLGFSGVILGARLPFNTGVESYVAPVYFEPFATQLALYTATVGGFDFWMEPLEPHRLGTYYPKPEAVDPGTLSPGTKVSDTVIARLNIYFPVGNFPVASGPPPTFSKNHPMPVFEYGTGKKNVQGYVRTKDKSQLVNQWYNLASGFPTANSPQDPPVVSDENAIIDPASGYRVRDSIRDRGGYEGVAPGDLGVGALALRQSLVDTTAAITALPRQQIVFSPTINCDVDWTVDYFVGDVGTVRAFIPEANDGKGSWRFNGTSRIYGVDARIDDNEQETIVITTIPTN